MNELVERILRAIQKYSEYVQWRCEGSEINFYVECSDIFEWGIADSERITAENIELLEKTMDECGEIFGIGEAYFAPHLFVARVRKTRPQNAAYFGLEPEWVELFDAVGPPRENNALNPITRPN